MTTYVLNSDGWIYTPNVVRYARCLYSTGTRKDKAVAERMVREGWGLPGHIAKIVLDPKHEPDIDWDKGTVSVVG